jgi:poly(3-hydroxybutyrate) depolymerase
MRSFEQNLNFAALAVLGLLLWAGSAIAGQPRHGEFPNETLSVGSATRVYRLVVPVSVELDKPAPLVIAFHGLLDNKDLMPVYTKLNQTAEKHAFIIAYPNALGTEWETKPEKTQADLAFFDTMLAKIENDYSIDPQRVFVVGMSKGGSFAHVVGQQRSKIVAAVAVHSGLQIEAKINAERKFPILIIHGDRDQIYAVQSARDSRDRYLREGHDVKYVECAGLGHLWGKKYDVNETIWQFFADHPLRK